MADEAPAGTSAPEVDAFASLDPFGLQGYPTIGEEASPALGAALAPPGFDRGGAAGGAAGGGRGEIAPLSPDQLAGLDEMRVEEVVGGDANSDAASQLGDEDDLSLPDLFAE
jgi:hypothetical protein